MSKFLIIIFCSVCFVLTSCTLKNSNQIEFSVDASKCNNCTRCIKECPTGAIKIISGKAEIDVSQCKKCGLCVDICPQDAIR